MRYIILSIPTVIVMVYYLRFKLSKWKKQNKYANYIKLCFFAVSFLLSLFKRDYFSVGIFQFGGTPVVLTLVGFEIMDTIAEMIQDGQINVNRLKTRKNNKNK